MIQRFILLLALVGLVLGGIYYVRRPSGPGPAEAAPPAVVAADVARQEVWGETLRAVGSVRAFQGVTVASEVAGIVRAVRFASGERVAAGEVLVELDDAVDQAELKGLLAQIRLAELQVERTAKLSKERLLAQAEADEARAKLDVAQAQVAAKRALIGKKRIRAPFGGLLGLRQIEPGQHLEAGAAIVALETLAPVYVDFAVPERHAGQLAAGLAVRVRAAAFAGEVFAGEVEAVSPAIDAATRSVKVRARLPNPGDRLRPGMFADVTLELPGRRTVLTVPRTAIAFNPYGDALFVVVADGVGGARALRRPVRVGEARDGRIEILEGLKAGERVVSAGHMKLRNEQAVRIDESVRLDPDAAVRP